MNKYQKQFDLLCRVVCYLCAAWWLLGFLRFLPDELSNRIVDALIAKVLPK